MKKLSILFAVISPLLITCIIIEDEPLAPGTFWAQNLSNSSYYKVDAELLAENNFCYVWAEKGSGVTEGTAQNVAYAYANKIHDKMLAAFGFPVDIGGGETLNTLEYANLLAKGEKSDKKLTILLLDIKDNYNKGVNESYVAGYFWAGNLYSNKTYRKSNECDMIYVDTKPGIPGSDGSNETLAHELQHLMNFVGSNLFRGKVMDTWIDEGLSVTAERVYTGQHSVERLNCYNVDISGLISMGNNFFVWGNRAGSGKSQYAVLDDYSTVYLFFQWLRLQSGEDIYREISISKKTDYNAVVEAFNNTVSSNKYSNWEDMLKDWLAANYFRNSSGRYGYGSDMKLNQINRHYTPGGSTAINLYPGEGVYSNVTTGISIPTKTGNINYAGLTGSAPISSGSISSGALLTYNANTNNSGSAESGTITGVASTNIVSPSSGSRSIGGFGAGPFPISAGDMLRQKGMEGSFILPLGQLGTLEENE